jgi:hypothetical protein
VLCCIDPAISRLGSTNLVDKNLPFEMQRRLSSAAQGYLDEHFRQAYGWLHINKHKHTLIVDGEKASEKS